MSATSLGSPFRFLEVFLAEAMGAAFPFPFGFTSFLGGVYSSSEAFKGFLRFAKRGTEPDDEGRSFPVRKLSMESWTCRREVLGGIIHDIF